MRFGLRVLQVVRLVDDQNVKRGRRGLPPLRHSGIAKRLEAANGPEFDRLFLEGMIKHHEGALSMVKQLFATPGAGQDVGIFSFASDVDADQRMEIERMGALLDALVKEKQ